MSLSIYGVEILVPDVQAAALWFQRNLFFEKEKSVPGEVLRNDDFRVILKNRNIHGTCAAKKCLGFQHFALETHDIDEAIAYCKSKKMKIELSSDGGAKFNKKVYGTGMAYFNICTDFGVTVEVSQKLHCRVAAGKHVIWGLEHIGIQVDNIDAALSVFENMGFHMEFEPVCNFTEGQEVTCCMIASDKGTIELYRFKDRTELCHEIDPVIKNVYVLKDKSLQIITNMEPNGWKPTLKGM